nr:MAG TPA: hypothetical protein [Caudoviricetes sp.]
MLFIYFIRQLELFFVKKRRGSSRPFQAFCLVSKMLCGIDSDLSL